MRDSPKHKDVSAGVKNAEELMLWSMCATPTLLVLQGLEVLLIPSPYYCTPPNTSFNIGVVVYEQSCAI